MRYSKLLKKFRCDIIRVDSFVVVTLCIQAYAVRLWTSTSRYNSPSFVMKFRIRLATILFY